MFECDYNNILKPFIDKGRISSAMYLLQVPRPAVILLFFATLSMVVNATPYV